MSDAQLEGANTCSRRMEALSSSTESLSSYGEDELVTDPFPADTQTFPSESTTGEPPPIQIAP